MSTITVDRPDLSPTYFPEGQASVDAQSFTALGGTTTGSSQPLANTQNTAASAGTNQGQPAKLITTPNVCSLADPTLALAADILDDLEKVKNANQNRLRTLTRNTTDADGEMRGFGLDTTHPDVARLAAIVDLLTKAEHDATLNLQRAMRKHALGPWVKQQKGVGEKQAARLLAAIGDPYWNNATNAPRTVSALWAYCGLHVANGEAARRRKGVQANWSTNAKTRAWLIIEACMKQLDPACKTGTGIADHTDGCRCSPYRVAVDNRRHHTATTHPDWTAGHSLNDAMRVASKQLLRDLWREAHRAHTEGTP